MELNTLVRPAHLPRAFFITRAGRRLRAMGRGLVLAVGCLAWSTAATGEEPLDREAAAEVKADLAQLDVLMPRIEAVAKRAQDLRARIDTSSDAGLLRCLPEGNVIRQQEVPALRQALERVDGYNLRMALVFALDHTFSCAYCAGDGRSCSEIDKELNDQRKQVNRHRRMLNRGDSPQGG